MDRSVFRRDDGGIRGVDANGNPSDEIYFVGIIDILTTYGPKKRVEHAFKSIFSSDPVRTTRPTHFAVRATSASRRLTLRMHACAQKGISALPADEYAERFKKFMFSIIE